MLVEVVVVVAEKDGSGEGGVGVVVVDVVGGERGDGRVHIVVDDGQ